MIETKITTDVKGPLFDGRLYRAIGVAANDSEREIAQTGVSEVRAQLSMVLKNPTGFYESQIQTNRAFGDYAVTDGDVIYGPWLDGSGSRNRTTRFKGYAHWRRATDVLNRKAPQIVDHIIDRHIGGL